MTRALALFDLDGTLVDSQADIRAAVAVALLSVGPPDPERDVETVAAAGHGQPLEELFAIARPAPHPAAGPDGYARFAAAYRARYHEHLLETTRPYPGVEEMLAEVSSRRARGLRVAVATTKKTDTARRVVTGLGLDRFFDLVLGSDEVPHKPAPDLLFACARLLEREPSSGIMVGDTDRDVLAGRAAGMLTVGVAWGSLGPERLAVYSPDHLIRDPREILALLS